MRNLIRFFQLIRRIFGNMTIFILLNGSILCFYDWPFYVTLSMVSLLMLLSVAFLSFEIKKWRLRAALERANLANNCSILGLDLYTLKEIKAGTLSYDTHFEVVGGIASLRNAFLRLLEMDVSKGKGVIIIVPEGEKRFLEEVTYVLRERKNQEEIKPFFYFSSCPDQSASYSPFYKAKVETLASWCVFTKEESDLLEQVLRALRGQPKPFDYEDVLSLLETKKAVLALGNRRLIQGDYLFDFDSLRLVRASLAHKINQLVKVFDLKYDAVTKAYPIDLEKIAWGRKHFLLEFDFNVPSLSPVILTHLILEIEEMNRITNSRSVIYFLYPEALTEHLEAEEIGDLGSSALLRIFSTHFYMSRFRQYANTLLLPGYRPNGEEEEKRMWQAFYGEIKEVQRGKEEVSLKSLFNEETPEAVQAMAKELSFPISTGIFMSPTRHPERVIRFFYLPSKIERILEYEPYQRRYKTEDMLHLRKQAGKIKGDLSRLHPTVIQIIDDLRPK